MPRHFFDVKNGHRLIEPAGPDCRNGQEPLEKNAITGRGWVVWDRVKRGPAVVAGRELARLSREDAYAAIALLNGPDFDSKKELMPTAWQVSYSGITVDCRDEQDAKSLARELVRKGFRVSAETIEGAVAARRIEPDQMEDWLLSEAILPNERYLLFRNRRHHSRSRRD